MGHQPHDLRHIQPGLLRKQHALGHALNDAGNTDLIDHFCQLAAAGRANMGLRLGIRGEDRLGFCNSRSRATTENAELAVNGTLLTTGDGSINKALPRPEPFTGDFSRDVCRDRGVINQQCMLAQAGQNTFRALQDLGKIFIAANASQNKLQPKRAPWSLYDSIPSQRDRPAANAPPWGSPCCLDR